MKKFQKLKSFVDDNFKLIFVLFLIIFAIQLHQIDEGLAWIESSTANIARNIEIYSN